MTEKLIAAAREFIAKCDRGEARSVRSYAAFKEALAEVDGAAPVKPVIKGWFPEQMTDDELRAELATCEQRVEQAAGWPSAFESAKMLKKVVAEGNRRGLGFVNKFPIQKGF